MGTAWCPDCRALMMDGTTCTECRRRKAWGTILGILATTEVVTLNPQLRNEALAAAAFLMQDRQALLHQHRREMRDEAREASRGSGEAYRQGRDDGQREGRDEW